MAKNRKYELATLIEIANDEIMACQNNIKSESIKKNRLLKKREVVILELVDSIKKTTKKKKSVGVNNRQITYGYNKSRTKYK